MEKVVIIGGGVTGLATAYRLFNDHGIPSIVLEAGDRPGGKAKTETENKFVTETGTNGWLDKEPAVGELLRALELEEHILPSNDAASRRFIFRDNRLRELHMHPLKFMTGDALPFGARMRVAFEPFVPKRKETSDESLAEFAARRLGKQARDFLIGPMAFGVYAGDPDRMSLRSCFGKVHALEENHGSLIKGMIALKKEKRRKGEDPKSVQAGPSGKLTSLRGGVQVLIDALADRLGSSVQTGTTVNAVEKKADGFRVLTDNADPIETHAVISAAPAWAAAAYLQTLDTIAAEAFGEISYPSLDVVCLGFPKDAAPRSLDGFGFLVPRKQGITILGSLWTSSIFSGRAPSDCILLRTMIGGMLHPEVAKWREEKVVATVRKELETILGIDASVPAIHQKVFRHPKAIPQYHIGHEALREKIFGAEKRLPGFFATGNSLKGIGVVDCIRESSATAESVAAFFRKGSSS